MQLVLLILGCFTLCWLPYFAVASMQMFSHRERGSPTIYKATFSLAMVNSGMNPMIYAWKNCGLRAAFGRMLRGRHPDHAYEQWTDDEELAAAKQRARLRSLGRLNSTETAAAAVRNECAVKHEDSFDIVTVASEKPADMRRSKSDLRLATLDAHRLLDILHIDTPAQRLASASTTTMTADNQRHITFAASYRL